MKSQRTRMKTNWKQLDTNNNKSNTITTMLSNNNTLTQLDNNNNKLQQQLEAVNNNYQITLKNNLINTIWNYYRPLTTIQNTQLTQIKHNFKQLQHN